MDDALYTFTLIHFVADWIIKGPSPVFLSFSIATSWVGLRVGNEFFIFTAPQNDSTATTSIGVTSYGALGHVLPLELGHVEKFGSFYVHDILQYEITITIRNLYSAIMPLGGYRGAGGTGR